jgi:hypothetical protein
MGQHNLYVGSEGCSGAYFGDLFRLALPCAERWGVLPVSDIDRLDSRLVALLPVIEQWRALRAYLSSLDVTDGRPVYHQAIKWIDDSLARIEPQLTAGRWPPVWWRLGLVDFDLLRRNFYRADSEGYFRQADGYVPEREQILEWVDRIDQMYRAVQQARG